MFFSSSYFSPSNNFHPSPLPTQNIRLLIVMPDSEEKQKINQGYSSDMHKDGDFIYGSSTEKIQV